MTDPRPTVITLDAIDPHPAFASARARTALELGSYCTHLANDAVCG